MNLSAFINHLVREGQIAVVDDLPPLLPAASADALEVLTDYYHHDKLEMPATAPEFDPDAALWAATYIYQAVRLIMLRSIQPNKVLPGLSLYTGRINADSIYSADLCLRYLPDLLSLTRKLDAQDALVMHIRETAMQWPFSSTGMQLTAKGSLAGIISSPALLQAYADRIIVTRDYPRCGVPAVRDAVNASLGDYASVLWPGYPVL
ncbi:hypothetical protein [Chitinophaga eiseniae]|uniref:MoxR-vWA-beta-propeller ternary system domain-containing protein n=1 Tax=Chitinophaga eiseniae TaxID=634771 RepID=A0A847SJ70_9BACT|nr:hypothetical protein [Chitinophaga eiseniae]NLR79803.1 hypothetical protein [Chitinophaga eiseniae]